MVKDKKEEKINKLEDLGLDAIEEIFGLTKDEMAQLDNKQLNTLVQKSRIAMQFFREVNLNKRCEDKNKLRVLTLISKDKEELHKLLKRTLPKYYTD